MSKMKKDKQCGRILVTTDYDKFTGTWDNRISLTEEPDSKDFKKLKSSIIETNGNISPIIVNNKFEIIEGHHRLVACKATNMPIKYMVQDDFNLDTAIKLSETTSKWSNDEKVKRGVKHEVPLCLLVNDVAFKLPAFSANYSTTLLRVCEYLRWAYPEAGIPANTTVLRSLVTKEGIDTLKKVEITDAMKVEVVAYHTLLLAIARSTEVNYNEERDKDFSLIKAFDKRLHQSVLANYPQIMAAMPEFLVEWENICKRKKYRGNKDIYSLITSHNSMMMNEGFRKLLSKPVFLKK